MGMMDIRIADLSGDLYINRMDLIDWVQSGIQTFPPGLPRETLKWLTRELTAFGEPVAELKDGEIQSCYLQFSMNHEVMRMLCAIDPKKGVFYQIESFFDFLDKFCSYCKENTQKNMPPESHKDIDTVIRNSTHSLIKAMKDVIKETTGRESDWSPK